MTKVTVFVNMYTRKLSFSINDGKACEVQEVLLPECGVRPWLALHSEGDKVKVSGVEFAEPTEDERKSANTITKIEIAMKRALKKLDALVSLTMHHTDDREIYS